MKRFRTILMTMVAVFAISAVGASAASAGTFSGMMYTSAGDCAFTGATSGWGTESPGWSTDLGSFVKGTPCPTEVSGVSGSGHLYKQSDGTAKLSNIVVSLTITPPGITCQYSYAGPWTGTWAWGDAAHTYKVFNFAGGGITPTLDIPPSNFGCLLLPVPTISRIDLDVSNP